MSSVLDAGSLSRLQDIWVPAPVSWWPLAPGWYALAVLVLGAGALLLWRQRRRRQARRYRDQALAELQALRGAGLAPQRAVASLMVLLKRTALAAYPRSQVAPLTGAAWWAFLDDSADGVGFASRWGPLAAAVGYGSAPPEQLDDPAVGPLFDAARQWIVTHRAARER